MENFGEFLARKRKEKNMSQTKFAEMVGVSRQAVAWWETNKDIPKKENICKISLCLGISEEYCNAVLKNDIKGNSIFEQLYFVNEKIDEQEKILNNWKEIRKSIENTIF